MSDESLFTDALAISAPAERAAFLDRASAGNPEQRRRIDELLAAHFLVNSFLARSAGADSPDGTATYDPAGTRIKTVQEIAGEVGQVIAGKYKLMEAIGEGGMGTVWMALQTEPVKRTVAVKVIKAGMDSKAVLVRFEAERQALAMMDHPNIAKVLDAGATASGRPYFVMELVKGIPITEYCDGRKLTTRQRLELFVPVCNAIQHAHQKGIIHRDIKPSNVLVALYDDRPVPKVIDFGIAKATDASPNERTLMTGFGAVVGTPEYMSPEQANMNNLDIDTRSDVYSLGVLLYELLTGSTPVDRKSLGKAALLEILRIVREVEAPKPSAKLSTVDTLPSVAACRGTEPAKLSKLMRGELDWVVLKALEKDRTRRYDTANGLAADVQRYLADEPVQAVPPSLAYRVRKAYRRQRAAVVTSGAFLLVLVAATVVSLVHATRATLAERDAIRHGLRAEEERQKAEAEARKARKQAEIAEAVKGFLERDLIAQANPLATGRSDSRPDPDLKLKTALDRAVPHIADRFEGKPLIEASIRRAVGNAYSGRGLFPEAQTQLEKACDLYRAELTRPDYQDVETHVVHPYVEAMLELINLYSGQGQPQKALATIPILEEQLRRSFRDIPEAKTLLEMMAGLRGILEGKDPAKALQTNRELLRKLFGGASTEQPAVGRTPESNPQVREGQGAEAGVLGTLQRMESSTAAIKLMTSGKYPEAEVAFKRIIEPQRAKGEAEMLVMIPLLAEVQRLQGKFADARANYESARDGIRKALGEDHPSLGACHYGLSQTLLSEKKYAEAETAVRAALAFYEKRMPDDLLRFELTGLLGSALLGQKKFANAEPLLTTGYEGIKARFDKTPEADGARLAVTIRVVEAVDRLVELYGATDKPGEVKKWRAERAKYPDAVPKPGVVK